MRNGPVSRDIEAQLALLRTLAPRGVRVAGADPESVPPPLFKVEEREVARAVAKRRREFAHGRATARAALSELGVPTEAIPVGPDRAPIWPDPVVGSITHCGSLAAAAVAFKAQYVGLGLDAEIAGPLQPDLARLVCRESELGAWQDESLAGGTNWEKVVFSAKESVYKAVAPWTGERPGFQDVEIVPEGSRRVFRAVFVEGALASWPEPRRIRGWWGIAGGVVLTFAAIAAAD